MSRAARCDPGAGSPGDRPALEDRHRFLAAAGRTIGPRPSIVKPAHGAEDPGPGGGWPGAAHREDALPQEEGGPVVAGGVVGPGGLMDGLGEQGLVLPGLGRGEERLEDLQRLRVCTTVEESLGLGQPVSHGVGRQTGRGCELRRGRRLRGKPAARRARGPCADTVATLYFSTRMRPSEGEGLRPTARAARTTCGSQASDRHRQPFRRHGQEDVAGSGAGPRGGGGAGVPPGEARASPDA
jgi:hypothetical protein